MDLTKSFGQLAHLTWGVLFLIGSVINLDEEEFLEPVGNYTISIKLLQQTARETRFNLRLFGDQGPADLRPISVPCKNQDLTLSDIDDLGRICSIKTQDKETKCSIDQVKITDNLRKTVTLFKISGKLSNTETRHQPEEPLAPSWGNWTEWQKCNCEQKAKIRTRTCHELPSQCKNAERCHGKKEESEACVCENSAEGSSGEAAVVIPIIAGIAAILIIVVVAGICYSRRLNKRKEEEKDNADGLAKKRDFPIIVITPPDSTGNDTSTRYSAPIPNGSGEDSSLIAPVSYPDDDVLRHPPDDIEWEDNDLYASSRS